MISVHRRTPLSTEKSEEAVAGFEPGRLRPSYFSNGQRRFSMRGLSYIIALVFLLTGPSLAGSTGSEMPGVGAFNYRGAPVGMLAPKMIAQLGR
jgi:hypothetical protein